MLTSISIKNFALIESLSINFESGFSTITGETGAGKSILLGALGLALGKRADLSSLKHKEEKCIVEVCFDIENYDLKSFFDTNDLDFDNQTIIRREILPSGKSRAFVNDSPINLNELQELGTFLIDIHSQNQTRELSEDDIQFLIIDAIAENQKIISDFEVSLSDYKKQKTKLQKLSADLDSAKKEQDYNSFLLNELLDAKLKSGDQEILETSFEQLSNVGLIAENFEKAIAISADEQFGASNQLKEIKQAILKIAPFAGKYQEVSDRIASVLIEFDDVLSEINNLSEQLNKDPEQLEMVTLKLQNIYNLQQKHQVKTIDALLEIQNQLDNKVLAISDLIIEKELLEKNIDSLKFVLDAIANTISDNRKEAIPVLSQKLTQLLDLLGMPNAQFNIILEPTENFVKNGKDHLQFLFSANKGANFGLLKKTASGGEMSRIMLATKAILSGYSNLPTIIFDEIDTGVSGEIANKMAAIMKKMSLKMQVFSITHLPQIAAKGNVQFKVFKTTTANQTQTELKLLSANERVLEIAEMLSGANPSESAINHAKTLLQ